MTSQEIWKRICASIVALARAGCVFPCSDIEGSIRLVPWSVRHHVDDNEVSWVTISVAGRDISVDIDFGTDGLELLDTESNAKFFCEGIEKYLRRSAKIEIPPDAPSPKLYTKDL